jgi:hypothetical protein
MTSVRTPDAYVAVSTILVIVAAPPVMLANRVALDVVIYVGDNKWYPTFITVQAMPLTISKNPPRPIAEESISVANCKLPTIDVSATVESIRYLLYLFLYAPLVDNVHGFEHCLMLWF